VKENRNAYEGIVELLETGDTQTAHRVVHTLKSAAGYLGKKELQEAASSLEESLMSDSGSYTERQLNVLKEELSSALLEFEPIAEETSETKPEAVEIESDKLTALLEEIEPLLKKGDFAAVNYVEKLQGIEGMQELAESIDEYDFTGALKILKSKMLR